MTQVVEFFKEALSLVPITRQVLSKRTEFKSSNGEVAIDKIKDENAEYYSMELELDKFVDENHDSKKIDDVAKSIATEIGLENCEIVDLGTEAIYSKISGIDFFEAKKNELDKERIEK